MQRKQPKNRAQQTMETNTRFTRYLRIPPSQTKITSINISTYINEKPQTSFENTLIKQKPHL